MLIAGWMHGNGNTLLYMRDYRYKSGKMSWCVTENTAKAKRFDTPEACIEYYLNKHAFPEEYIQSVRNGHLLIWDEKGNLLHSGLYLDNFINNKTI